MSTQSNGQQKPQLTAYEREQVEQIAEWKSTEPSRLTEAVDAVTLPIAWGVKRVVPRDVVRKAIDLLASTAVTRKSDGEIDTALLLDGLEDERQQGITIDVAYRYFATARRKFIIADTPGHEQFTRNMATGA